MNRLSCLLAVVVALAANGASAAPADLDPSFGSSGIVLTDVAAGFDNARDALLLPGGRILVCGNASSGSTASFLLVRYGSDGVVDATFGPNGNGRVTTVIPSATSCEATSLALQNDGHILVAGHVTISGSRYSALARYDSTGALDTAWGALGRVTQLIGAQGDVWDVLVQPDDKIVLAGAFRISGSITYMGLRRYLPDGTPDATFGAGGTVTRGPGVDNRCYAIALADSGKLMAVGTTQLSAGADQFLTFRFNANGTPDSSFATFGRAITSLSVLRHFATDVEVLPDRRILVGGYVGAASDLTHDYAVARFRPNGTLDPLFGSGGISITPNVGLTTGFSFLEDLLVLPDGKLLLAGQATNLGSSDDFAMVRMDSSGTVDPAFGTNGMAFTDVSGGGRDTPYRALLQPDGRIVLAGGAGTSLFPGGSQVALTRYLGDAPTAGVGRPPLAAGTLALALAGPNPFRAGTALVYSLPRASAVALRVFDVEGRAVATLVLGDQPAGEHHVAWDGSVAGGASAPAGLYFARLEARAAGEAMRGATRRLVRVL